MHKEKDNAFGWRPRGARAPRLAIIATHLGIVLGLCAHDFFDDGITTSEAIGSVHETPFA